MSPAILGAIKPTGVPGNPAAVRLLIGTQTPEMLFNSLAGRISLVYRETLIPVARLPRSRLGLAGYLIDPDLRSSGYDSRVEKVVVADVDRPPRLAVFDIDDAKEGVLRRIPRADRGARSTSASGASKLKE